MDDLDTEYFRKERHKMVEEQLVSRGIQGENLLEAFRRVPRHVFVNKSHRDRAYSDSALPTEADQTISQPYMVATMTEKLDVNSGQKVLEVGTGSGYQTAILLELGARVFTVEKYAELTERAKETLEKLGYRDQVEFHVGDGSQGWHEKSPYERILVTAGSPEIPKPLKKQAACSARIVIPVGTRRKQTLRLLKRIDGGNWQEENFTSCVFVPLEGSEGWSED